MATTTSSFITRKSFLKKAQQQKEEERIFNGTDLPSDGDIFCVDIIEKRDGKFGDCHLLYIVNEQGEKKKVWSPSKLIRDIGDKSETHIIYFTSLGQSLKKKRKNL